MRINEKIKIFFHQEGKSNTEISGLYGATSATIGNYLNGRREIPVDFVVWLKKTYPDIDLNILFKDDEITNIKVVDLEKTEELKREIAREIEVVLSKYLH